jgi:hypothetical protein
LDNEHKAYFYFHQFKMLLHNQVCLLYINKWTEINSIKLFNLQYKEYLFTFMVIK